jgi:hypothetical protein
MGIVDSSLVQEVVVGMKCWSGKLDPESWKDDFSRTHSKLPCRRPNTLQSVETFAFELYLLTDCTKLRHTHA